MKKINFFKGGVAALAVFSGAFGANAAALDLPDSGMSIDQFFSCVSHESECNALENSNPFTGFTGMGLYLFRTLAPVEVNRECAEPFVLKCNGEVVVSVSCADVDAYMGYSPEGYMEMINFGVPRGAESVAEIPEQFLKEGTWTLTIPNRAYMIGDMEVTGQDKGGSGDIVFTPQAFVDGGTYTFKNSVASADRTPELFPAPGSEVTDLNAIKITFPNQKYVGYHTVIGTLTFPDGTVKPLSKYALKRDGWLYGMGNWMYVGFSPAVAEFPAGEYKLHIEANCLYAGGSQGWEGTSTSGNVEAIDAVYYVADINTGVSAVDAAADYTVVSVDGKQLLRNADASALSTLRPGLYIINGKKVAIRK